MADFPKSHPTDPSIGALQGCGSPHTLFPPPPDRLSSKVGVDFSTNTDVTGLQYSFSPQLCLQLLKSEVLTMEQIRFEYKYFHQNFSGFSAKHRTRQPSDSNKISAMYRHFVEGLEVDMDRYVQNLDYYDQVTTTFSNTVEELKVWVDKAVQDCKPTLTPTLAPDVASDVVPDVLQVDLQPDTEPVFFLPSNISCNVEDLCEGLEFTSIGDRHCAYFGTVPYNYGHGNSRASHVPKPYPESGKLREVLDSMVDQIDDPSFNLVNYTCLVTCYRDGGSHLNFHSDDESCIHPDSTIYCLSLGESRTIKFRSKNRTEFRSCLPLHGSIYGMSRHSQDHWEHSVPRPSKPVRCGPRVSLTLRYLTDPPVPRVPCTSSPCTGRPAPEALDSTPVPPAPKRVLFITDSIHAKFNVNSFGENIVCHRKLCFKLRDVTQFEKLFSSYDIVFVSAGVNDLMKDGHSALSLISGLGHRFEYYSQKYCDTVFIYNSILHTSDISLNREIDSFNSFIFNFTLRTDSNFWFFDTHNVCWESNVRDILRDGTHLTSGAADLLQTTIVQNVTGFLNQTALSWPLRSQFGDIAHRHRIPSTYIF